VNIKHAKVSIEYTECKMQLIRYVSNFLFSGSVIHVWSKYYFLACKLGCFELEVPGSVVLLNRSA
jgi:hypothetical protein